MHYAKESSLADLAGIIWDVLSSAGAFAERPVQRARHEIAHESLNIHIHELC